MTATSRFLPTQFRSAVCFVAFATLSVCVVGCNDAASLGGMGAADGTAAAAGLTVQEVKMGDVRAARYVKLVQVTEVNGGAWAAIAEFNLLDSKGSPLDRKAWKASADSADVNDAAALAIDGDPRTLWHTRWQGTAPPPPHELVIDLGAPARLSGFRMLPRQDGSINGTLGRYRLHLSADGVDWGVPVSAGDFASLGQPGLEKTVVFAAQTPNRAPVAAPAAAQTTPLGTSVALQLLASDPDDDPLNFSAEGLPPGLAIGAKTGLVTGTPIAAGQFNVQLKVADSDGATHRAAFAWKVLAPAIDAADARGGGVRFVKLEQLSEINGKPWAAIAEFNLLDGNGVPLPRTQWTASADSSDLSDSPANAIDGNPATLWHSQWDGAAPPPPHSFIVDMRRAALVQAVRVLPRQDRLSNGTIGRFRIYTSIDGVNWGKPVTEGDFAALGPPNAEKTVALR